LNDRVPVGSFTRQSMIAASGSHPPDAGDYFAHLRMDDHTIIKPGWNELIVTVRGLKDAADAKLTMVQLGVIYDRKYLDLLYK
jgi:hypothetical protein